MSQGVAIAAETQKPFGSEEKHRARGEFRAHLVALKRSPHTVAAYTQQLQNFFAFIEERALDLRAVRPCDIEAYQVGLLAAPASVWTIHLKLRAVRRFYDWLERSGKILINPAAPVAMPKIGDRLPRAVLSLTEIRKLLDAPDTSTALGIRDKTMLEVFYSTGLRLSELLALTVHDVDVLNGYVRVNGGKGGKDRVVPMGRKASAYVKEYLRHVRGQFTKRRRDERALFVGEHGKRIHLLIVERLVKSYARAAGIKKRVTPHVLRHTCATHLIASGASIAHAQRLLGHACITTTQVYTRVVRQDLKKTHAATHPRA